jgi:hypothetical protein
VRVRVPPPAPSFPNSHVTSPGSARLGGQKREEVILGLTLAVLWLISGNQERNLVHRFRQSLAQSGRIVAVQHATEIVAALTAEAPLRGSPFAFALIRILRERNRTVILI